MDEEICDGVKILCERMENNPEDFVESDFDPTAFTRTTGKYYYDGRCIDGLAKGDKEAIDAFWYLSQAEKDALTNAYKTMKRNEFTRRVVEKLLDAPTPEVDVAKAMRKANRPVTMQQIQNESLALLNKSFDDAYVYKASGRYATGFTAQEIGPVAELKKWATE